MRAPASVDSSHPTATTHPATAKIALPPLPASPPLSFSENLACTTPPTSAPSPLPAPRYSPLNSACVVAERPLGASLAACAHPAAQAHPKVIPCRGSTAKTTQGEKPLTFTSQGRAQ